MPDDFLCDPPVDSKRYAVDPSDSAFNVMTSQYQPKHSYGYRGSSCSAPVGLCRQASSPGSFQEGNRNGVFLKFRCTVMKSARNLWKSCAMQYMENHKYYVIFTLFVQIIEVLDGAFCCLQMFPISSLYAKLS